MERLDSRWDLKSNVIQLFKGVLADKARHGTLQAKGLWRVTNLTVRPVKWWNSEAMQAAARPRVAWHNLRNFVNLSTLILLKALVDTSQTSWFPALTTVCWFPDSKTSFRK